MTAAAAIDKIKKLLRMKRGGTPAEVETALALARDLAAKHGIDLNTVDPTEDERVQSQLSHHDTKQARAIHYDTRYAARICEQFFNVDIIYRKGFNPSARGTHKRLRDGALGIPTHYLTIVGRKLEIAIARYILEFLRGHFARTWNTRRGRCRKRHSFVYGMYVAIRRNLDRNRTPPSTDLVLSRAQYIESTIGALEKFKSRSPELADSAFRNGYLEGLATNLRTGLAKTEPVLLSPLPPVKSS